MEYTTASMEKTGNFPLVKLLRYFVQNGGREKLIIGGQVVPDGFNSSLRSAAAPEHLISGLIGNHLHEFIYQLGTIVRRHFVQLLILSIYTTNILSSQGFFMSKNEGPSFSIGIMTMSAKVCLLLCVFPFFFL